jgi:serine/threonine protein kinase
VLDHPNVVKYYGALLSPASTDVLLLCQFCSRGSLLDLIHNQRKVAGLNDVDGSGARQKGLQKADLFAAELVLEILVQISLGLKYLHDDMSLAHGNLSSANVVLDGSGMVKITDVGLEDAIDSTDSNGARDARDGMTRRGGRGYWSPERSLAIANGSFLSSEPTAPADCWAMGCVASELLSGVFVDERLQLFESISLAQEHKVLAAILTEVERLSSCGQCGQSGKDTCAGCRVAWVTAALLTREATRRPVAGRVASLLETPASVGRLEPAQVGRTAVPPLSIPPPWHRRAGITCVLLYVYV